MPIWRLSLHDGDEPERSILVEGSVAASVAELVRKLGDLGVAEPSINGRPGIDFGRGETFGSIGLRNGSVVSEHRSPTGAAFKRLRRGHPRGWYLIAVTGPGAGATCHLPPGRQIIGRDNDADFVIADPMVSGMHAAIGIDPDPGCAVAMLEDLDSSNGTNVDGRRLDAGHHPVTAGSHVLMGATVLELVHLAAAELAPSVASDLEGPTVAFPRRFRTPAPGLPHRLRAPHPPAVVEPSRSGWWRSLTPLATGIGFAYLTGRWEFLLLSALAPLIFAVDAHRQRSQRTRNNDAALAEHVQERLAFARSVHDVRHAEEVQRRTEAPTGGMAVAHCLLRSRRLWERRPEDDDFGTVTLGLANLASGIDADDIHPVRGAPMLSTIPLTTSLLDTGALLVRGSVERRRGVTRSLLIGLCASHAPSDLEVCILTSPEGRGAWRFATWLPHAAPHLTYSLAHETAEHDATLSELRRLLDTRRANADVAIGDGGRGPTVWPLLLVIIDGILAGNAELAVLLDQGPRFGIIGIVAEQTLTIDGLKSSLTLDAIPGSARFASRHQPDIDLRVAELTVPAARSAALRLAGLRPTTDEVPPAEHGMQLLDVLGWEARPDWFSERWERMSPCTKAVIGVSRGVPLMVDLAKDGPHGLLGGMSGSGKTELLMTLLTSLCLNNHPDDLGIVIVDFKGGVDHELTAQLPHVIDLSTNLDVDQFQRTIDLLQAEQLRRQRLLRGCASDLDGYREVRRTDPSLPPLPRLLVVIDEFSELLASDDGRRRLQELVSVTRIGRALGIHLLLVTQNFEGQLPPQIEANAGLRLCLRVMKPAHSKVVLDTGIASTLPPHAVGRGYLRSNGGEVIEFQTARVVGPAVRGRGPSSGRAPAAERVVVRFEDGSSTGDISTTIATPIAGTDMTKISGALRQAAVATGWCRSAIPWPGELPERVALGPLLGSDEPGLPIGLEDRPDEQRHAVAHLAEQDEQVLLLGPGDGSLTDVLAVIGTSAAVRSSPNALHLFGIDLDGSGLDRLRSFPHCSVVAVRDDALALRTVQHLRDEAARRRPSMPASSPSLLLLVAGADRLTRRGDEVRHPVLQPLMNLLNEAHGVNIRIILAGSATLADSRLGAGVDRQFVFSSSDDSSGAVHAVPRAMAASLRPRGRAFDVRRGRLVQIAQMATERACEPAVLARLSSRLECAFPLSGLDVPPPEFPVVTWPMSIEDAPPLVSPPGVLLALPIGINLADGSVVWADGDEDGPVFAITGPARSGKSVALASLAAMFAERGLCVVVISGSRRSPLLAVDRLGSSRAMPARDLGGALECLHRTMPPDEPIVILVDDAHRLEPTELDLTVLAHRRHAVFLAGPADFFTGRSPTRRLFPPHRSGLVLCPTSPLDGSAIGAGRIAESLRSNPRPGRGLVSLSGQFLEVQILESGCDRPHDGKTLSRSVSR